MKKQQPPDGRWDAILSRLESLAALDFSRRLTISDKADSIDALAAGLNMLSEELEASLTARKRAEEALRQKHEALAHVQRVATMGEMVSALAHEFNQPLTAVLSNAQATKRLLEIDAPDLDNLAEIIDDIIADVRRSGEIMRRLRVLLQKQASVTAPLDLNAVVEEAAGLLYGQAELRNIAMDLHLAEGLPPVLGDSVQLQQVLVNLIRNGFDAMNSVSIGERTLVIETADDMASGVHVSVHDTGVGVDEQNMQSLFTPFHTTKAKGLGMGLSISRSIIEEHRGRIWAERNPDRGMSFHFTLPGAREGSS